MPLFLSLPCPPAQQQPGNFSSLTPGYSPLCALYWLATAMRCSSAARHSPRMTRGDVGTVLPLSKPCSQHPGCSNDMASAFPHPHPCNVAYFNLSTEPCPANRQVRATRTPGSLSPPPKVPVHRDWEKANLDSLCVTLKRLSLVEASRARVCANTAI
jgi:hypothetical protein